MTNKMLANCIITSLILCVIGGVSEEEAPSFSSIIYSLAGILWIVFGIWSATRLYKIK